MASAMGKLWISNQASREGQVQYIVHLSPLLAHFNEVELLPALTCQPFHSVQSFVTFCRGHLADALGGFPGTGRELD